MFLGRGKLEVKIEKATSENNVNENWGSILDVCDMVTSNTGSAKECLRAILKRMNHEDPHVIMQAITLLDACSSNCGKPFHLVIASYEFETEFRRLLTKSQPKVAARMCQVLKSWAETDYKKDPELNLIPSLCEKLMHEDYDFGSLSDKPKSKSSASKEQNAANTQQQEEAEIAYAIQLSLKDSKSSPKHQVGSSSATSNTSSAYPSLYPSVAGAGSLGSVNSTGTGSNNSATSQTEPRKVRALYDFEAAEENELTFFAGEIIHVLDDTDPNWWKGMNQRGDGLFPSNFVTADLSVDPERLDINQQSKSKKNVQFDDDVKELQQKTEAAAVAAANQQVEIDEIKIDRLLHLLHEANPEDPSQDSDEMLRLEQEVHQMGPLIDAELEHIDRKHAQLTQLSSDLVDAINMYHSLMRDGAMMNNGNILRSGNMMQQYPGYGASPEQRGSTWGLRGYAPQMSANYGLHSLPYSNTGQLPPMTVPPTNDASIPNTDIMGVPGSTFPPNAQLPILSVGQQQISVPMSLQNGHLNSQPMNSLMNALPHINSSMPLGQQMQHPHPHPQNFQMLPQQTQQQLPPQSQYPQQQQQQQQQPSQSQYSQQLPTTAPTTTTSPMPLNGTTSVIANETQTQGGSMLQLPQQSTQQQQQFIPPLHQAPPGTYLPQQIPPQQQPHQLQQQQHQPYTTPMPNGPQNFVPQPQLTNGVPGMMQLPVLQQQQQPQPQHQHQQQLNQNHSNNNNTDQFSQLQQQMSAMSMGINHPQQR
ncbi:signal transducing adapter molecule 1-like isoform X2 [Teleopsis dalmanni]|uniref:signal transducing adapter molecule 1-like isoform X2 n=1 Tax=Teleopsis dalmanni TaxID=139649 RepID=UPI0018CE10E6|nr:signal transducing adapter molecule 1-like isoform X2 [Teleopsis dalmanni]